MGFARINQRAVVLLAAAGLVMLGLVLSGWQRVPGPEWKAEILGPSMSPTLWGPTLMAHCGECGWTHPVHTQPDPRHRISLRCFRCGARRLELGEQVKHGQVVSVRPREATENWPPRDALVAFRSEVGQPVVKRVIGLPGDLVQIDASGRLWINARRWCPSRELLWTKGVEVYQMEDLPSTNLAGTNLGGANLRWRAVSEAAIGDAAQWAAGEAVPWQWSESAFRTELQQTFASPQGATAQWLRYHHIDVHNNSQPAPIRDDDPANIALSRQTKPVADLRLALRVRHQAGATAKPLLLSIRWYHPAGDARFDIQLGSHDTTLRMLNGDRQWSISFDGGAWRSIEPVVDDIGQRDASESWDGVVSAENPLALRVSGVGKVELSRLWVGRAVRYDPPSSLASQWAAGVRVRPGYYLLMGDNPPNSTDSRSLPLGVPAAALLGQVELLEGSDYRMGRFENVSTDGR